MKSKSRLQHTAAQFACMSGHNKPEIPRFTALNCNLDGRVDLRLNPMQIKQRYALLYNALSAGGIIKGEREKRSINSLLHSRRIWITEMEEYLNGSLMRLESPDKLER